MRLADATPGLVVRYADGHLASTSGFTDADRAARFIVEPRHLGVMGRKRKPICYLCALGLVPVDGARHIHPDSLDLG